MKINVDRMALLAGLKSGSGKSQTLSEQYSRADEAKHDEEEMTAHEGDVSSIDLEEEEDPEKMDEMIEVDEVMLVQELRRAKKLMAESRQRARRQHSQEARLQKIIEEEVQNIFGDLNLNADWIYGGNKPKRSKKGYVHQGSYLKGLGFK